jgi:hypothetical protein
MVMLQGTRTVPASLTITAGQYSICAWRLPTAVTCAAVTAVLRQGCALFPGLLHIFSMMAGEGHGPADANEGGKG